MAVTVFGSLGVALVIGVPAVSAGSWRRLGIATAATAVVLVGSLVLITGKSTTCGTRDQRTYDAWIASGADGLPPVSCGID